MNVNTEHEKNQNSAGKSKYLTEDFQSFAPFSKTILTQSLLDIGLDVDHAYEIANAITASLDEKETWLKREVAEKVAWTLSESISDEFADAYKRKHLPSEAIPYKDRNQISKTEITRIFKETFEASGLTQTDAYALSAELVKAIKDHDQDNTRELVNIITGLKQKYSQLNPIRWKFRQCLNSINRPIVILIGGGTGSGKSTLAAEIGYRLGITKIISTDSIREIMRAIFSKKIMPSLHLSSYEAYMGPGFDSASRKQAVINAFLEQAQYVRVGAQALIERNIVEHVDMIVDGVHLVPGVIQPVNQSDGIVIPMLITIHNVQEHRERFKHRERRAKDRPAKKYLKNFEAIRIIQDKLVEISHQNEIPVFNNEDVNTTVDRIITHILYQIEQTRNHANPRPY